IRDLTVTGVQTCALPIYLPFDGAQPDKALANPAQATRLKQDAQRDVALRPQERPGPATAVANASGNSQQTHDATLYVGANGNSRSEERRVGKEGRTRAWR